MYTHKKLLLLIAFLFATVCSCNKSKKANTVNVNRDPVDSIVGTYTGSLYFHDSHSGGVSLSYSIDTVLYADSCIVIKTSADSFHFYLRKYSYHDDSTITYQIVDLVFKYSDSNYYASYDHPIGINSKIELYFFPENDSTYFEVLQDIGSGALGFYRKQETLAGKKIK